MANEYNFNVSVKAKSSLSVFEQTTKAIINQQELKLQCAQYNKGILKGIEDCSGNYKFEDIKAIKNSGKYLIMTIFIITLIFFSVAFWISDIIFYVKTGFSLGLSSCIGGLIIIHIICILLCKVNTVKIILKNNKSIHIPIRYIFWESIDYKNSVYEFIKEIKMCIKTENN